MEEILNRLREFGYTDDELNKGIRKLNEELNLNLNSPRQLTLNDEVHILRKGELIYFGNNTSSQNPALNEIRLLRAFLNNDDDDDFNEGSPKDKRARKVIKAFLWNKIQDVLGTEAHQNNHKKFEDKFKKLSFDQIMKLANYHPSTGSELSFWLLCLGLASPSKSISAERESKRWRKINVPLRGGGVLSSSSSSLSPFKFRKLFTSTGWDLYKTNRGTTGLVNALVISSTIRKRNKPDYIKDLNDILFSALTKFHHNQRLIVDYSHYRNDIKEIQISYTGEHGGSNLLPRLPKGWHWASSIRDIVTRAYLAQIISLRLNALINHHEICLYQLPEYSLINDLWSVSTIKGLIMILIQNNSNDSKDSALLSQIEKLLLDKLENISPDNYQFYLSQRKIVSPRSLIDDYGQYKIELIPSVTRDFSLVTLFDLLSSTTARK